MKTIIQTDKAPAPIGPYSQAILINDTLYTSGQIALDAESGELVMSNIQLETRKVMKNLQVVLEAAGMSFENVVKSSIFLSSMKNFNQVNEVYASYFDESAAPARETVEVSELPKKVNVEISMIAVK
ncbi:MAG: Rid family detoxifying hydrolase [Vicingaceae bacterium]|jgi:2-iminobutanoate/2-iminopropanoate deaminase|tara:strand:+ start:123 stop:503 length:381 start_codon:yes stop_codon:yes gene_type:complete